MTTKKHLLSLVSGEPGESEPETGGALAFSPAQTPGQPERLFQRRMSLPERLFAERPDLASKDARAVTYVCQDCGVVTPHMVANGFLRRACPCEQRARELDEAARLAESIQAETVKFRAGKTYTWLGPLACEPGLEDKLFSNFDQGKQPDAYARCLDYEATFTPGESLNLLLASKSPGTGKTHLACAIANALRSRGVTVRFATVPTLYDALFRASGEEESRLYAEAADCKLLILDDLTGLYVKPHDDPEKVGLFQKSVLFKLINARYIRRLPTLITANTDGKLDAWLDEKTRDRFFECCEMPGFVGKSYRQLLALQHTKKGSVS